MVILKSTSQGTADQKHMFLDLKLQGEHRVIRSNHTQVMDHHTQVVSFLILELMVFSNIFILDAQKYDVSEKTAQGTYICC